MPPLSPFPCPARMPAAPGFFAQNAIDNRRQRLYNACKFQKEPNIMDRFFSGRFYFSYYYFSKK